MDKRDKLDRRSFMGGALGVGVGAGMAALLSGNARAQQGPPAGGGAEGGSGGPYDGGGQLLYRLEADVRDCQVEGTVPTDLNGAFYRVGPDPQYPLAPGNIPFDGEGHVSMFRIKDGRVDYRSRFVRNERYLAQDEAGRILFPMYRNPSLDDPSVRGLSRSTANTHIINYQNMLLALKEDSPPSALDLLTLDTVEPNYTFGGKLPSQTFTAHPKVDSETGNIVAFGYEATGIGSDDVHVFEIDPRGDFVWTTRIKVPYVGMLHDFAVTERFIVFYVIPMIVDREQMERGGIHFSWDSTLPTYFGFLRRGGDGSDLQWIEGPTRSSTHVMGAFSDGNRLYFDGEMSMSNPFPFMPMRDGSRWDPAVGTSFIHRFSVDLSQRRPRSYSIEQMYPHPGALPRQDDRYNTVPYRYGFMGTRDPEAPGAGAAYARFDNQTRNVTLYRAGQETQLNECCFAPRGPDAPEGSGYLMGVAHRSNEGGRSDLVILDAERLQDGPVATVKLPMRAIGQVHGWWVPEGQLPG
jgi:carotenoid cleavage dioxygenase-like enzyme